MLLSPNSNHSGRTTSQTSEIIFEDILKKDSIRHWRCLLALYTLVIFFYCSIVPVFRDLKETSCLSFYIFDLSVGKNVVFFTFLRCFNHRTIDSLKGILPASIIITLLFRNNHLMSLNRNPFYAKKTSFIFFTFLSTIYLFVIRDAIL